MVPIFLFTLIGCCLFIVYGALIDYYRRAWVAIPMFVAGAWTRKGHSGAASGAAPTGQTRLSVLVPARNEEANIAHCLASLAQQSYPKDRYEVIVIDDHSTDMTGEIVTNLHFPGMSLSCIRLADAAQPADPGRTIDADAAQPVAASLEQAPGKLAYKKFAIETGIRAATGELIVTTDADCTFDADWLITFAAFYEETGAKFIAAPVRIGAAAPTRRLHQPPSTPRLHPPAATGRLDQPAPARNLDQPVPIRTSPIPRPAHTFLSIFQTLDFITLQGITGAAVSKRFHSMCNGANLAYEKSAFFEVEGFKGIASLPSGDDMLLMHKIYTRYPDKVYFLKSPKAIVSTEPSTTWTGFINQRVRWASKADRYDDKRIFWVLLLVYIVNVMFALLPVAACWNTWWLLLLVIGLLTKTMLEFPFVYTVAGFFDQQSLLKWFPLMQPFHILYTVVIGWMGKFGSYRWKGRTITK